MSFTAGVFDEVAPGRNTFIALGIAPDRLQLPDHIPVEHAPHSRAGLRDLDSRIADSRVVIFHSVTPVVARRLAQAPVSTLKVWSGWGGDYYGTALDYHAGQLGEKTARLEKRRMRLRAHVGRVLHAVQYGSTLQSAARNADVFSAPIPEDLAAFTRRFRGFTGQYRQLNYVSVEDSIATVDANTLGSDILVGNSASPVNNHLEMFELLSRQRLSGRRVVVPLSYGNAEYARRIIEAGAQLLGEHFVPITEYLSLIEYNELVGRCGTVVMGHLRQAAVGNVLRAIWQGAHLVLDPRNPLYQHLTARGVSVVPLESIVRGGLPTRPLSETSRAANHAYLDDHWSRKVVLDNARELIALAH